MCAREGLSGDSASANKNEKFGFVRFVDIYTLGKVPESLLFGREMPLFSIISLFVRDYST